MPKNTGALTLSLTKTLLDFAQEPRYECDYLADFVQQIDVYLQDVGPPSQDAEARAIQVARIERRATWFRSPQARQHLLERCKPYRENVEAPK